jgi:hypothetical protein
MSKIFKNIIGYIVFTIVFGLMIYFSVTSPINRYEDTNEDPRIIIYMIIFGLIFATSYWIAKKLTEKGYSRLKVRLIFSTLVALGSGIVLNVNSILSGSSISFIYTLLTMAIVGIAVFMRSYGDKTIKQKDLLDFNREEGKKLDLKKSIKNSLLLLIIMLFPLLSIFVVVIIICLVK